MKPNLENKRNNLHKYKIYKYNFTSCDGIIDELNHF